MISLDFIINDFCLFQLKGGFEVTIYSDFLYKVTIFANFGIKESGIEAVIPLDFITKVMIFAYFSLKVALK